MKIVEFRADNFKNLKCVQIRPDGSIVNITGKNGAGKSAVLEAIFTTLTGTRIDDAVRHGEEKALVEIDMGDYLVSRKWTPKGEYLKVDGLPKGETPQGFLDKIIGKLSFDPLGFTRYKPKEQLEILKKLVGLDFTDLEQEAFKVSEERKILNSKVRDAIAQLDNSQAPDPETPDVEISYKDELQKINVLREDREAFKRALGEITRVEGGVKDNHQWIEAKRREIARLETEIRGLETANSNSFEMLKEMKLPPEVTQEQIQAAEANLQEIENKNVQIRSAARYRKLIKESERLKNEAESLNQKLDRIGQDKATRIANAQFPVPGLGLGDENVIYNNTPFQRLSTGERLIISTAIGMKLNPKLKVIFIQEGSELDESNMTKIAEMAQKEGYDIWMTRVMDEGKAGIYLEDGSVTSIDGKKVTKAHKHSGPDKTVEVD